MVNQPKYIVQMAHADVAYYTPMAWPTKRIGRATDANLARFVADMQASYAPGGCNAHLNAGTIEEATVYVNNGRRDTVVATWTAGA